MYYLYLMWRSFYPKIYTEETESNPNPNAVKFNNAAKITFHQLTRNKSRIFVGIIRSRKTVSFLRL